MTEQNPFTTDDVRKLMNAQFLYTAGMLESAAKNGYSDDDTDYIGGAMDTCDFLMHIDYEAVDAPLALWEWLTMEDEEDGAWKTSDANLYAQYPAMVTASDGLCAEIWDLMRKYNVEVKAQGY